jgi:acyl-CoA dehydrogenase
VTDVTAQARAAFATWRARVAADPLDQDPHLVRILTRTGHAELLPDVRTFARICIDVVDPLARESNQAANLPRLDRYDGQGNRTEGIRFDPSYHHIGQLTYATGVIRRYQQPGQELASLAFMYQLSQQGEAGHACPLACTAGLVKILQHTDAHVPEEWLDRLLDPDYDTHFHGSQFLTEVQGGSDVGRNAVVARPHPDDDGTFTLHGEKWFCSVADAQLFLVTARPEGECDGTRGLGAFVVPRHLDDGAVNGFRIRRLKDKLGTRSMASAEIDFEGARGWRVGDFRDVVSLVLNTSRLYNAVACCGILQRAWREADAYARTRTAFGQPILAFPTTARTVARLRAEAYGARATTFRLAHMADRIALGEADALEQGAWRALVNLNKYWTSVQSTLAARDAIEVLGGNGAIEDFSILPRLLRDSIVVEAWEGGHNVLCAQVLRDAKRLELHRALFGWLDRHLGGLDPALSRIRDRWEDLVPRADADVFIRDLVDELRPAVQAALLRQDHAADPTDPLEPVAADHLAALGDRGWDPLADEGLVERVRALTSEPLPDAA